MNLSTIQKRMFCSKDLIRDIFLQFWTIQKYSGLNVIIKSWIVKILSKFKRKGLGIQQSKVYEPLYHSKENFMF